MKTTLNLPDDVALTLRMESARRGGRRKASYSQLVADAIRRVYGTEQEQTACTLDLQPGRAVVHPPPSTPPVHSEDVRAALDEL